MGTSRCPHNQSHKMKAGISIVRREAEDILGLRLVHPLGAHFAPFTDGSHID